MDVNGISVIIPHHGVAEPTLRLIELLHRQSNAPELQIIVSDDASPEPFPEGDGYEVERCESNGGFGSAVNRGVTAARHGYLLVLNSDVEPGPCFVDEFLARARPWLPAVVAPPVDEPWGERCVERTWPTIHGVCVEHLVPLARFHGRDWMTRAIGHDTRSWRAAGPHAVDWAVGVCLLLPTEDFRAVGGFDERFFMNCEEIDLQRRLRDERGLRSVVLDSPRLPHVGGASSPSHKRAGWLMDSRFAYEEKWGDAARLYLALHLVFGVNALWGTIRRAGGRPAEPRRVWKTQLDLLRHAWTARR